MRLRFLARCCVALLLLFSALASNPVGSLEQRVHDAPVPGGLSVPSHQTQRAAAGHENPDPSGDDGEAIVAAGIPPLAQSIAHVTFDTRALPHASSRSSVHHSALANPPPLID
jgi:hypothetical protein